MAPLPFNNTDITFIDYQNAVGQHTFMVRNVADLSYLQIGDAINDFLIAISPMFVTSTIISTRYQNRNQNFSAPKDFGLLGTGFGSGIATPEQNATAATFVGRDDAGRRGRLSVFGFKQGLSNYRLTTQESTDVTLAVQTLNSRPGVFLTVVNAQPVWYSYADIKANDYWVRRARG